MANLFPAEPATRISLANVLKATVAALIVVVVANAIIFFIADAAGAIPDDFTIEGPTGDAMTFGIGAVIFASAIAMVAAGVIFGIVTRVTRKPFQVFGILALIVFLLSLFSPFTIEDAPAGMIVSLLLMHAVAAILGVMILFKASVR